MDAPYSSLEALRPGIARLLARNPSPYTYSGTQTYLVGDKDAVIVVDPGPDMDEHVDAIVEAIGKRELVAISCTHTHRDHSPASRPLKERLGAPIIGCAPLSIEATGPRADASFDSDYAPDRILEDGESLRAGSVEMVAVATPGHTSNHLCYAADGALLTGDHVMGWSTTVVVPPDGDMEDYMASLEKLRQRDDQVYYPAHGPAIEKPQRLVRHMIGHRLQRERQIVNRLKAGDRSIEELVANCYPGLDERLVPAAGGSVHAHLVFLERKGMVRKSGEEWEAA
ncbi:glyoxylase-like metal-dependent hydrolase (beta-lactamase superfamily II) [Sphingomicrobium lutaoense]|uniref:Glyoxylase-like metal-dependent hydrolase (Beta-lactamase superfamily II) n=1 Tax=Sphingomicrobium lutaoense TaxID=515949 RepID=A0A839Z3N5_9SPHN|nr:MBL fold metallo-hydrolase [Sphingomicrobium lutaoense]MBB3764185.1 glyoxylase-like metal-dependent hydrolase (beta-lactamase superfamily II) [Sphingomicrobium lutaoense]